MGGLEIRDLHKVNRSLGPSLSFDAGKSKRPLPLCNPQNPNTTHITHSGEPLVYGPKSVFWASLLKVKNMLHENCTIQIHKGSSWQLG